MLGAEFRVDPGDGLTEVFVVGIHDYLLFPDWRNKFWSV